MKSVQQRWAAHVYEIRPRADKHRVDLISDALPYRPWYRGPNAIRNAIDSAKFHGTLVFSRAVFLLIALYSLVEIPGIAIFLAERRNMVLRCFQDGFLAHVHKYLGFLVTDPVDMLR